jgi:nucleoid DNA-binding protein
MVEVLRKDSKVKNPVAVLRCAACQRLISKWVADLGYTINHGNKNYCRFCYVQLRNAGKIHANGDDIEFMNGINWELSLIDQVNQKRGCEKKSISNDIRASAPCRVRTKKTVAKGLPKFVDPSSTVIPSDERAARVAPTLKQEGLCPACRSSLSFNIRGHANAEGICPKCNRHIQFLASGIIKLVPTRAAIILSVSRRTGVSLESVEEIYSYVIDEIAARLSEHPILGIPELGTFRVKKSGKQCDIEFTPSRQLVSRVVTGSPLHEHDVSRLFTGTQVHADRSLE